MTPYDLKTWRLALRLTQEEAAALLGVGYRTYQRHEEESIFRIELPGYIGAAAYGVNAAVRDTEPLLDVIEWPREGARFWNNRLSGEEMRRRTLFAVARHLLNFGKLSGKQEVWFGGQGIRVTFPQNCVVPGTLAFIAASKAPAKNRRDPGRVTRTPPSTSNGYLSP